MADEKMAEQRLDAKPRQNSASVQQLIKKMVIIGFVLLAILISIVLCLSTFSPVFGPFWEWF